MRQDVADLEAARMGHQVWRILRSGYLTISKCCYMSHSVKQGCGWLTYGNIGTNLFNEGKPFLASPNTLNLKACTSGTLRLDFITLAAQSTLS
jgi:hypothetical protein